jgi:hypothetical protein
LNVDLNPICHLLALSGAHHIFHVSRIRVKEIARFRLAVFPSSILSKELAQLDPSDGTDL